MKLFANLNIDGQKTETTFVAKQIIDHKMPKIESNKWQTRSVNIGGKFTKVYSRNGGSYFVMGGVNYYVASPEFKNAKSAKIDKSKK